VLGAYGHYVARAVAPKVRAYLVGRGSSTHLKKSPVRSAFGRAPSSCRAARTRCVPGSVTDPARNRPKSLPRSQLEETGSAWRTEASAGQDDVTHIENIHPHEFQDHASERQ